MENGLFIDFIADLPLFTELTNGGFPKRAISIRKKPGQIYVRNVVRNPGDLHHVWPVLRILQGATVGLL